MPKNGRYTIRLEQTGRDLNKPELVQMTSTGASMQGEEPINMWTSVARISLEGRDVPVAAAHFPASWKRYSEVAGIRLETGRLHSPVSRKPDREEKISKLI